MTRFALAMSGLQMIDEVIQQEARTGRPTRAEPNRFDPQSLQTTMVFSFSEEISISLLMSSSLLHSHDPLLAVA